MSDREKKEQKFRERYAKELEKHLEGMELKPGVYITTISHDNWCDFLAGRGPCNCNPDIGPPERVHRPEEN
jgi:hypothetical protein